MTRKVNLKKIGIFAVLLMIHLGLFIENSWALSWTYSYDPYNDATGGNTWEVYRIGYAFDDQWLYFNIWTGYPTPTGYPNSQPTPMGLVTYGNTTLEPGDLYINVNGQHNTSTGTVYGLGLTDHSGDMTNDPNDNIYAWLPVQQGHLYSNAIFATGTYEAYPNAGITGTPYDGGLDPFGHGNNYPTFIAGYGTDLGPQTQNGVTWVSLGTRDVDPSTNRVNRTVYEVNTAISLASLGLQGGGSFEFWWAPECGNDAAMVAGQIPTPEPATLGLLTIGLIGLRRYVFRHKQA